MKTIGLFWAVFVAVAAGVGVVIITIIGAALAVQWLYDNVSPWLAWPVGVGAVVAVLSAAAWLMLEDGP